MLAVNLRFAFAALFVVLAHPVFAAADKSDRSTVDPARFGNKAPDAAYGAFQRGLYLTALNLALEEAKKGDAAAQSLAAEIYARGLGVAKNPQEAARLYGEAAKSGYAPAQFQYALLLMDGEHVEQDEYRGYDLMKQAADAGITLAQFNFAQLVTSREPGPTGNKRAADYYEMAAQSGLADAQYALGIVYANGSGGRPKDEAEARKWFARAAQQNFDTAQLELGLWLVAGKGGPKNEKAGFNWLKVAANGGNVVAQNRLAKLIRAGIGTEGDPIEAAAWYIVARRAGLTDPEMDIFLEGLTHEEQKAALERANLLR